MRRNLIFVIICAGVILSLSRGIRNSFGVFLIPVSLDLGIGREGFAFAMAVQNILIGIVQPLTGILADKYGTARVLVVGGAVYALGLLVMANAATPFDLNLGAGLLVGVGAAATSYAVVLGAIGRRVAMEKRSKALGLTSAIGSLGQFAIPPVAVALIAAKGWPTTLVSIALCAAIMVPLAAGLPGRAADAPDATAGAASLTLSQAVGEASRHGGYRFLTAGFFVCGFQVTFIATHLPAYLTDVGLSQEAGGVALALIGFFNVIGTYGFGYLGDRYSKKYLLSALYLLRALAIAVMLTLPKTESSIMVFAAVLGLLWLGTVPLTSGLVAQIFGPRYMATLFAIVFFSHQLGAFLGPWLGGHLHDATGSYDAIWIASIVLGLAAALLHLPIAERPLRAPA